MALFIFLHKDVRNNRSYEYQKSGKHAVISQHYKTTLGNIDSKCRAGVYSEWSQYFVVVCRKKGMSPAWICEISPGTPASFYINDSLAATSMPMRGTCTNIKH